MARSSAPWQSVSAWVSGKRAVGGAERGHVAAVFHSRLSGHPKYEFGTPHSRLLILGTAALAAAHALVLVLVG